MKRVFYGFSLGLVILSATSCKKDKEVNCTDAAQRFNSVFTTYSGNPTTANCLAVQAAFVEYFDNCETGLSDQDEAEIRAAFNENACD